MFFDRLLKLTSLKSRLLNATSFSQLYSQEKLPLSKFRREGAMLSPLIAGLLAACGGGGGGAVPIGGGGGARPRGEGEDGFTLFVLDGAIEGAKVFIDINEDGAFTEDVDIRIAGETDSDGKITIANEHRGKAEMTR